MGKKKKSAPEPAAEAFSHNPFAVLSGAPVAPSPEAVETKPAAAPPTRSAWQTKVVVRRETKGRGGKTVTRVCGLPTALLPDLALRMKRALGCGAVVEGEELVLLGSLVERTAAWLEAQGAERVIRGN